MSRQVAEAWKGKRVAVVGLARSGVAACFFLRKRGAVVTGTDLRVADLSTTATDLADSGVALSLGLYPDFASFDALILSPGVDPNQPVFQSAAAGGVRILPELELGAREARGRIICVTGTKGKSTTTLSLQKMLTEAGLDARAVGNIGEPFTAHLEGSNEDTVFVTEASSFQLETTREFHADCAVFVNLFPDHLDRHPTFESYAAAKARIFANQTGDDTAVVNGEDPKVMDLARGTAAKIVTFRPRTVPEETSQTPVAYYERDAAVLRDRDKELLFKDEDVRLPGGAVRANLLAAGTVARLFGAPTDSIRNAVRAFHGVRHTFERLGEVSGVSFFNDSKATTLESVSAALESFDTPVLAIMGGRLKAGSFTSLRDVAAKHVRAIYAIGESRGLVREALSEICPVHEMDTLEDAVRSAHRAARTGETILLSPGCSSFDMFRDYADRGDTFRRAFQELKGAA